MINKIKKIQVMRKNKQIIRLMKFVNNIVIVLKIFIKKHLNFKKIREKLNLNLNKKVNRVIF